MYCLHCGAQAPSRARYCPSCGGPLEAELAPSREIANAGSPPDAVTAMDPATSPPTDLERPRSPSSGWLTSSDSISHGRFSPGSILDGRYRLVGLLGRGGMGEVYRADDLRLGQPVALKFLPDRVGGDPVRLAQFHNEVRSARQVSHPNICRVHDIGETDGHLFLSMEYVDGEDLASSLRRIGRFSEDKGIDIARQLCAGLSAAHERGVLHRDLKPANVMLDGAGRVRLMDFGLAAVGAVEEVRAGTPAYMAPEQLLGREVTVKSDLYSLGLVLYELFTGRRAFVAASLAELVEQHQSGQLAPPRAVVPTLDPAIERAILRCLDPDPARRPTSALAVAAALPGGDPLAAALAAGETPSPEMVAAAGEREGLSGRVALPVFAAIVLSIAASYALALRSSPLPSMAPELTPDVLAQKARDAIRQLGYAERAQDAAYGFEWDGQLIDDLRTRHHTRAEWNAVLSATPSPLLFWYRRSEAPMTAMQFHNDLLTPGIVTPDDPTPTTSGTIVLKLDHRGFVRYFEAIPPQVEDAAGSSRATDWNPMLTLAGLEPGRLQATDPRWNWLAAADARAAWTGTWPGSSLPLRIEAASLRGRPVAFVAVGPWTRPWRSSADSTGRETALVTFLFLLTLGMLTGGTLLARKNLREGRGDRGGAVTLASLAVAALLALWVCRVHVTVSTGLLAAFLLAVCTSVFYGVLFWATYLALEPFVRRHWPQTLVSWTTILGGRVRDRIVGRDLLVGVALGITVSLLIRATQPLAGDAIVWPSVDLLLGTRSTIGEMLTRAIYATRTALFMVLLLVLLRVVFRYQWAAALAFVSIFSLPNTLNSEHPLIDGGLSFVYFSMFAATVLRWGLTSVMVGVVVTELLLIVPAATDLSAWYLGRSILIMGIPLALAAWALYTSMRGRTTARGRPAAV